MERESVDDRIQSLIEELKTNAISPEEFTDRLKEVIRESADVNTPQPEPSSWSESELKVDVETVKRAAREARSL